MAISAAENKANPGLTKQLKERMYTFLCKNLVLLASWRPSASTMPGMDGMDVYRFTRG
jgi:hypothetical protein